MSKGGIFLGLIFIVLGIIVKHLKLYFLIAGYNTMPKKDKEKVNINKVATLFRNVFVGMGIAFIVGQLFANHYDNPTITNYFFYGALGIGLLTLLIKSNSKKYKRD